MTTKPVKRFIAGAVCPRCAVMDRLRVHRDEEREYRECTACGYEDRMRLDGRSEYLELDTRVNKEQRVQQKGAMEVQEQVLTFVPTGKKVK